MERIVEKTKKGDDEMPSMKWSDRTGLEIGRYAEYYAKMEFTSYGFEVFTSELDDHGVDFIAHHPKDGTYFEIQVKSIRDYNYAFVTKDKMESLSGGNLPANRLVCLLRFEDGKLPEVYIIPAKAWEKPNDLLKDKDYDGLKSKPEWGINVSRKNLDLLKAYEIETFMRLFP